MAEKEYWRWAEYAWKSDEDLQGSDTITAGIDVGSVSTQALILVDSKIHAYSNLRTGSDSPDSAKKAMDAALKDTGLRLEDIQYVVGTGYGRVNVPFADRTVTEIACHGRGAHHLNPEVRTILDMGGQDCKAIQINERGKVVEFLMNDKCAAGTGRGMEVISDILAVPIDEVGPLSLEPANEPPPVSSTCVIFAKTEAMGLLREGRSKADVLAAYCNAMAHRVSNLMHRLGLNGKFAITGGIAKNIGIVKRVEKELETQAIEIKPDPQIAGALGAALFARDLRLKSLKRRQS